MKNLISRILIFLIVCCCAPLSASAADYFARGVAHCILDDGSGTFPVSDAGEVFVGIAPTDTPQWTAGSYTSAAATGSFSASGTSVTFYFWARAKAGYTFVGWGSTKTSKTPTAGTESVEGKAWDSKTTLWTPGSEASPKTHVRYAIFRKNAAEDTTGGGVPMSSVDNYVHTQASTTGTWPVKIIFDEPLAYKNFAGYSEGYGANTSLIGAITCKSADTEVQATAARVGGSPTLNGEDAYGLVYFPAIMPVGTYAVHIPKGLFTTASGQPTAAADFTITITPDTTPFTIASTSPEEGYDWDSSEATQSNETDGLFSTVTLTFNKNIARVETEGKEIVLTNSTTGRISRFTVCSVSATTNKRLGVIAFDGQPNGNYTLHLPAGVFFDAVGNGNEAFDLHFSIKGSALDPWILPNYTTVHSSLANYSSISQLSSVTFTMSRNGYAAPVAINAGAKVTAVAITETFNPDDEYDPEATPNQESEDISGIMVRLSPEGELRVNFTQPVTHNCRVIITVPAGLVTNVPKASTMSPKDLYNAGGCTNGPIQLNLILNTGITTDIDAAPTAEPKDQTTGIFTVDGKRVNDLQPGVNIVRTISPDGTVSVRRVIR